MVERPFCVIGGMDEVYSFETYEELEDWVKEYGNRSFEAFEIKREFEIVKVDGKYTLKECE